MELDRLDIRDYLIEKILSIYHETILEIEKNRKYQLKFIAGGRELTMDILLPLFFPFCPPEIFVKCPVPHSWFARGTERIVVAPSLLDFDCHGDLATVIDEIICELKRCFLLHLDLNVVLYSSDVCHIHINSLLYPEYNGQTIHKLNEKVSRDGFKDTIVINEVGIRAMSVIKCAHELLLGNIPQQNADALKRKMIRKIKSKLTKDNDVQLDSETMDLRYRGLCELYSSRNLNHSLQLASVQGDPEAELFVRQFLQGNVSIESFLAKFKAGPINIDNVHYNFINQFGKIFKENKKSNQI